MHKGKNLRRVRCPDDLWLQLEQAVATAGDGDRSTVTRRLWRLYIDQPTIRKAVQATPDQADTRDHAVATADKPVATAETSVATGPAEMKQLRQHVATLRSYGYDTGLPPADVQDTIKVWLNWYATQPVPCDFTRIEQALDARAEGEHWRPQT
jgi:hypothetical protein